MNYVPNNSSKNEPQQQQNNNQHILINLTQKKQKRIMKQKYCLSSVSSFKQINTSSINNSKTKQTFSFSKTPRFQSIKPVCEKATYGGDFVQHRASGAGIGYGKRSDFTRVFAVAPSCTQYNIKSEFEENVKKMRGSSVGLSRDNVLFNQYIPKWNSKTPSATKYQYEKVQKFTSPSYSLRHKPVLKDRGVTIDPQVHNPGPGAYNNDLNNSKYGSKFSKIAYGTSKSDRFLSAANGFPGVGEYKNTEPISSIGKYALSKHVGGTQAKFNKTSRATFLDEAAKAQKSKPGPGFYKAPSQFGQYDGDVYTNTGNTALSRFSKKQ